MQLFKLVKVEILSRDNKSFKGLSMLISYLVMVKLLQKLNISNWKSVVKQTHEAPRVTRVLSISVIPQLGVVSKVVT